MEIGLNFSIGQDELKYVYEAAQARIKAHPEYAEKQKEILDKYNFLKSGKDAFENFKSFDKRSFNCQVWVNIEKDEEYYYCADKWIVSNDYDILVAAEYLGFEQIPIPILTDWFESNKKRKG